MSAPPADDGTARLQAAREAYAGRDWPRAHELFSGVRASGALSADDVYALSDAAWWLGLVDESIGAAEEAHQGYLELGHPRQAARAATDIAVQHFLRGDDALGSGWVGRAQHALDGVPEGPEHGMLLYLLEVEAALGGIAPSEEPGELDRLIAGARRVREIGRRHSDLDLVTCGMLGEGRALVKAGRVTEGLALLDEAMLAVRSDRLRPEWAGNVYCHLMSAAHELADIGRSVEWTEATARWLERMPAAVVFTGICRVHRSQVHQVTGVWERAEREAALVCVDLADIEPAAAAEGHYQVGEIRRLRGDLAGAETAYQQAHRLGRDPQPGYALLRLAQGRAQAAAASVRAALVAASGDRLASARLWAAQVEIALAGGDRTVAHQACDQLEEVAAAYASSGLELMARHARGAVLLAEGRAEDALPVLRDACRRWNDLDAPYECARVRVLLAEAYAELDDADAASLELDAAGEVFARLGAALDVQRVDHRRHGRKQLPSGLTAREVEVLALVAAGLTNRDVANELVISPKTVARHLSNIFTKLGLSSRTAAAAYAFEHGLAGAADR